MTDNDRRLVATLIAILGGIAICGSIVLAGLVLWRLNAGDDMPPGVVSFLIALLGIGGSAGGLLAPSPLSKSSGADPTEVVGPGGGPVPVSDEAGQAVLWVLLGGVAAVVLLALVNKINL